jgi:acetyl esterase/lipase
VCGLVLSLALLASEPAATDRPAEPDIPYVESGTDKQQLDLYRPAKDGFATVVFVYGGGWHSGSRKSVAAVGRKLQSLGYGCALVGHRLSPPDKFPAHAEDVAAAFAWVHSHIAAKGGDPKRVVLMGHSSGAHLCLLIATDPRYLARHQLSLADVRAVVGLSPPVDLEVKGTGKGFGDVLMAGRGADAFNRDATLMKDASPINHVAKSLPPTLLVVGERDFPMLEGDAKAFADRAKAAGASAEVYLAKGRDHMGVVRSLLDEKGPETERVFGFLRGLGK